ncbi:unnamed protein product [Menidia menidia]|uniref:(Atlantic silverside) hypothetical protein n=1 Tax=Menidia menidia TaxID=238744 RepID=A0A8S4A8X5_9TELE|nr:unnamed protein product [Menidia menidia]
MKDISENDQQIRGSPVQPFSPFWFSVEPRDTMAVRGNAALLNCSAHSEAPARVEWKKDGTFMSLASDERRRVLPDGSLLFAHVVHSKHNKPDEGTYQCVATIDSLGSISSRTARLSVAGREEESLTDIKEKTEIQVIKKPERCFRKRNDREEEA